MGAIVRQPGSGRRHSAHSGGGLRVSASLAVGLDAAMISPGTSRKVGVRRRTRTTGTSSLGRAYLT